MEREVSGRETDRSSAVIGKKRERGCCRRGCMSDDLHPGDVTWRSSGTSSVSKKRIKQQSGMAE